jgi:sortase A
VRRSRTRVSVERMLLVVGVICVGWWTAATVHAWYFRSQQVSAFERATAGAASTLPAPIAPPPLRTSFVTRTAGNPDPLVGILDVPRLGISTPVITGDDDNALDVAAGHLADTPLPWERGNTAVAAHRDGLFRPLQHVQRGDLVRMRTTHGDFDYIVSGTRIVQPDDLSVLANSDTDSLTLITCYPFRYVGHAPQRFVVRADRKDVQTPVAQAPAVATSVELEPRPARAPTVRPTKKPARHVRAASPRDARQRTTVSRDLKKKAKVSKPAGRQDDRPKKKRRWYRLFL